MKTHIRLLLQCMSQVFALLGVPMLSLKAGYQG